MMFHRRVTLRKALEDPALLGSSLGQPSWHAWRSILLAAMGEELKPDELEIFSNSPAAREKARRHSGCHVIYFRRLADLRLGPSAQRLRKRTLGVRQMENARLRQGL